MSDDSIVRLDYVTFNKVQENYFCNKPLQVTVKFDPQFTYSVNDWIGLFKVGWTSIEEKIVSKKVPKEAFNKLEYNFTLESEVLPEDEDEFYHLCYITHNEQLTGVSIPFQFTTNDFEFICDSERFNSNELSVKMNNMEFENLRLKKEMESLQMEKEELLKRMEEVMTSGNPEGVLLALNSTNEDLKDRIEALQKENMELKGSERNSSTSRVSLTDAKSFSFMDEYYEDGKANGDQPGTVRPIGFENLYPNTWVTYETHPNTAYPEPTWFPNPYINYQPNASFNNK